MELRCRVRMFRALPVKGEVVSRYWTPAAAHDLPNRNIAEANLESHMVWSGCTSTKRTWRLAAPSRRIRSGDGALWDLRPLTLEQLRLAAIEEAKMEESSRPRFAKSTMIGDIADVLARLAHTGTEALQRGEPCSKYVGVEAGGGSTEAWESGWDET
ncbi:hypothetical protein NM208_g15706 [Fusarium decemcellulare]|uniref:Uncharacterized protein n=1 Tax=Fusarium decemcellulare TaxID=57161 RepID=A0ACC1RE32_9HYPO|nr:hypothetical protein NM208_g15706 [Fusarium decemcellulare]